MVYFSCDLVEESRKHIRFLERLHANGDMLTPVSRQSLDRYITRWLPLVADNDTDQLIPPSDVAWLWHCHRLAPMNYERYVRKRFKTNLLEPSPSFSFQLEDDDHIDALLTRDAWHIAFPDEPFFLQDTEDFSSVSAATIVEQCHSLEGFDLISSTQNQVAFLWQVSGPKFREDAFLHEAVENYHKFLKLFSTSEKRLPLVPTYQIDLMWHTHILWSLKGYHSDCISIRGELFHHDDSLNDRAPGGTLDRAFQATKKLWEDTYNEDYSVDGGMYRGPPPAVYYDVPAWQLEEAIRTLDGPIFASLTENSAPSCWLNPVEGVSPRYTDENSVYPDFFSANSRSITRNVNNNKQKNGYVFGAGTIGAGYYSLYTRDAYKILDMRLSRQVIYSRHSVDNYKLIRCLCWCTPSEAQRQEIDRLEKEKKKVRAMMNYVRARYANAIEPFYSNGQILYFSGDDLCTAAGCGGGVGVVGDFGGGGCGGGGCGGGCGG
jgi:hypothetical protein